jgi:hypothetical protein
MKRPHGFVNDLVNIILFLFAAALIIVLLALLDPSITRFIRHLFRH